MGRYVQKNVGCVNINASLLLWNRLGCWSIYLPSFEYSEFAFEGGDNSVWGFPFYGTFNHIPLFQCLHLFYIPVKVTLSLAIHLTFYYTAVVISKPWSEGVQFLWNATFSQLFIFPELSHVSQTHTYTFKLTTFYSFSLSKREKFFTRVDELF